MTSFEIAEQDILRQNPNAIVEKATVGDTIRRNSDGRCFVAKMDCGLGVAFFDEEAGCIQVCAIGEFTVVS